MTRAINILLLWSKDRASYFKDLSARRDRGTSALSKQQIRSTFLLPAPASCRLQTQGWPNRARYSGDEMNASTISAFTKLPPN